MGKDLLKLYEHLAKVAESAKRNGDHNRYVLYWANAIALSDGDIRNAIAWAADDDVHLTDDDFRFVPISTRVHTWIDSGWR